MTDEPTPDLLDSRGRLTRLAIALAAGVIAAVVVGTAAYALARPDQIPSGLTAGSKRRGYQFVYYFAALAGALAFTAAAALLAWRKRRADEAARLPQARVR